MADPAPAADLARVVALVPVRSLADSKSRLGEPLDPEERQELVLALLRRSLEATAQARCLAAVVVVSRDEELLRLAEASGAAATLQRSDGLNEAIAEALSSLRHATALLVLPADLPAVTGEEIDRLITEASLHLRPGHPLVALVADRHGGGTNALLVSPPDAIAFRFGEGSRASHEDEARRAGAEYVEIDGPLAFDVDTPEDLLLADLRGLDHEAGR